MKINFWKVEEKEPWQVAAARFCVKNSEKGFTKQELEKFVNYSYSVRSKHIDLFFHEEISLPSGRSYSREDDVGNWTPPLDLVSKITDYDELKEARKNAKQAFLLALLSNGIALLALFS